MHIHTVHEGHRDHKCKFCGKSFLRADNLKSHIHKVHEGENIKTKVIHKEAKSEKIIEEFNFTPEQVEEPFESGLNEMK